MAIGHAAGLDPEQRRFLLLDNGAVPLVANLLINGTIAWLMFRRASGVTLWGQGSIAGDTIATSFLLPAITCLIVTPIALARVRAGRLSPAEAGWRWIPRNMIWRALLAGAVCLLALAPLALLILSACGVERLTPWQFIFFKAAFAAVEGGLVTPFIALWAISEIPTGFVAAPQTA